jgi:O-antigen/teichoic acid export membrane protein
MAIYPVVTRAQRGTARFQRLAGLVLRGVCWTTVPAVAFLAVGASDIVRLLYGAHWDSVVPLLPLAAAVAGFASIWNALSGLLLANEDVRATLLVEVSGAVSAIGLAFVLIPYGARVYLMGLTLHGVIVTAVTIAVLLRRGAMSAKGVWAAIGPAAIAGLSAVLAILGVRSLLGGGGPVLLRVILEGGAVSTAYLATLRMMFSTQLSELLQVLPAGQPLARAMLLPPMSEAVA